MTSSSSRRPASGPADARPSDARTGFFLVILGSSLWGTVGIASKFLFALDPLSPLTVGFFRIALSAPFMFLIAFLVQRSGFRWPGRKDALLLFIMGTTQAGYQGFYFLGVNHIGVTQGTLIALCGSPVLITMLAALFYGEKAGITGWLAVPLAIFGTCLLIIGPETGLALTGDEGAGGGLIGYLAAIGAAVSFALFTLFSRQMGSRQHPAWMIAISFTIGALCLLPFGPLADLPDSLQPQSQAVIAYMAVVPTALAYAVFLAGIRQITASAAGVLVLVEPLVASLLAFWLFDEALGPFGSIGAILLLLAVWLVSRRK